LDRIGIPVYSAIMPRSRDVISVYNGKGFTDIDAKTGAAMEAIERYVASRDRFPAEIASYEDLARRAPAMDPLSINLTPHPDYRPDAPIAWLESVDLLSGESVFVPHFLACFYGIRYPWRPSHRIAATNGLASGNSVEEAACHALAEVIERDAFSIMEIIDRQIQVIESRSPWLRSARADRLREWKEEQLYPSIALDSLPEKAQSLVTLFLAAGLQPYLRFLPSDTGIPTVVCMVAEDISPEFCSTHHGVGTDPDPDVAVIRALTEAAQSRVVDMQAVREDLMPATAQVDQFMLHTRRGGDRKKSDWLTRHSERPIPLSCLPGAPNSDVVVDIRVMLDGLRSVGIERVLMVDLSLPEIPVKVVRILVPGMESWTIDRGKVGNRARAAWRTFAAHVS
jgi:ribosomal protein S12 methylthiotransferase accessory factor